MINLLRAELLRTFSSRIMLLVAVVGLAVGCWSGMGQAAEARPLSVTDVAEAEALRDEAVIIRHEACSAEYGSSDCGAQLIDATLEEFLRQPTTFESLAISTASFTGLLGLLAVVVAVTWVIGSEFSTGSLSTQLTFTPRRLPLLWAKVLTSTVASGAIMAWWLAAGLLINVVIFLQLRGVHELLADPTLALILLRYLVLGVWVGLLSALLTMAVGSTLRAWGLLASVLLLSQGVYGLLGSVRPWTTMLPTTNLAALLNGHWVDVLPTSSGLNLGEAHLSYAEASVYMACCTAVLVVWACLSFSRRDIRR